MIEFSDWTGAPRDLHPRWVPKFNEWMGRLVNALRSLDERVTGFGTVVDWTPTFVSGFTIGNGTVQGRYVVRDNELVWWVNIEMGSTSAMGTNPKVSVPGGFTLDGNSGGFRHVGTAVALDASASQFYSGAIYGGDSSDNTVTTRIIFNTTTVTATAPFTWTTGDFLWLGGSATIV